MRCKRRKQISPGSPAESCRVLTKEAANFELSGSQVLVPVQRGEGWSCLTAKGLPNSWPDFTPIGKHLRTASDRLLG